MFVGISGIDLGQYNEEAEMLWGQIIMCTVQECVYDHEGTVNKVRLLCSLQFFTLDFESSLRHVHPGKEEQ